MKEGGVQAALRAWNCSQDFEVAPRVKIYPTFYEKYFKKRTIKPKIEKRALVPVLYCLCSDICRGKSKI